MRSSYTKIKDKDWIVFRYPERNEGFEPARVLLQYFTIGEKYKVIYSYNIKDGTVAVYNNLAGTWTLRIECFDIPQLSKGPHTCKWL